MTIWGLSLATIITLALIMALAGFFQAAAGFGFALLAVPAMTLIIAPRTAIVVVFLHSFVTSLMLARTHRSHIEWTETRRLSIGGIVAMPLGVVLLVTSPTWVLRLMLGVVTITAAIWMLVSKPHKREPRTFTPATTYAVGALSGVLNTSLATNGPPLVVYLQALGMEATTFRATISMVFTVSNVVGFFMLLIGGAVHLAALEIYVLTFAPTFVGWWAGNQAAPRLRSEQFSRMVDLLLLAGGVLAIAKAF